MVHNTSLAVRGSPCGSAAAIKSRNCTTYVCNVVRALRGGAPSHNSSTSVSTETTWSARSASSASTCRGLGALGITATPISVTSTGPSTTMSMAVSRYVDE